LKNKNKSAKVQQQINVIKQQQAAAGKNKESVRIHLCSICNITDLVLLFSFRKPPSIQCQIYISPTSNRLDTIAREGESGRGESQGEAKSAG